METLGSHSRELIQVIQKLETLGINATLKSLPKFVVVGDQSAGKSSIVESICDISLPRSQETCTRCPYKITTTCSDSEWSCKVSLDRKFEVKANARSVKKSSGWTERETSSPYDFAIVSQKEELESVLVRAQLAILNPHHNPADYLATSIPASTSQLDFSPNAVNIHITGRGLPELSFLDLPGAINVYGDASEDKQHIVTFVERLAKSYLKDEKALVLLAVSCDQDTENSTAFRFVRECEASARCMGVCTKPDLLVSSRLAHIERILKGERYNLGKGWFVAKSLSQAEIDQHIIHAEAREREETFSGTIEPWSSALQPFANRFGVPRLQDAISQELTQHILNSLPDIVFRVERRLGEVVTQLDMLPEQTKAPSLSVMIEIDKVSHAVNTAFYGDVTENNFRKQYKVIIKDLRKQLQTAKIQVNVGTPGFKHVINILDDDDKDDDLTMAAQSPAKLRRGNDGLPVRKSNNDKTQVKPEQSSTVPLESVPSTMTLDKVRELSEHGVSGIPDQISHKVRDRIVLNSIQNWESLVKTALHKVHLLLDNTLDESIGLSLAARKQTRLYVETKRIANVLLTARMNERNARIYEHLAMEMHKPITYSEALLSERKEFLENELRTQRLEARINEYFDIEDGKSGKITKLEDRKKKMEDTNWQNKKLKKDAYAGEVSVMATPLAYYEIAAMRVVDMFALNLEFGLVHGIEQGLKQALWEGLDVQNGEQCAQLLADDPKREALRQQLIVEKEKLEEALKELGGLSSF